MQKMTLVGVKVNDFNGTIDGEKIVSDSTSFFFLTDLPKANGKAIGQASQEYKFGKADEFPKWQKIPLPCVVDAELGVETTGKNQSRMVLHSIKPSLDQGKPGQRAAA